MHANPKTNQIATEQAELEGAIANLGKASSENSTLLMEHLNAAKMYLLGGMPDEYIAELEMASNAAAGLSEKSLRESTSKTISHLKDEAATSDATRRSEMPGHGTIRHRPPHEVPGEGGRLWDFFGGRAPTQMGTFYPTSFVAGVLPTFDAAEKALGALRTAGFSENDAIAARGTEMSAFLEDLRDRGGTWSHLMAMLSRALGTEQLFADLDLDLAKTGTGFLIVYSPTEEAAKLIVKTVEPFGPLFMQRYLPGAVEGLVKPAGVTEPEC